MRIPYLDLKKVNAQFEDAFRRKLDIFLKKGMYILSDEVRAFEKQFANYCGSTYAIGVGNGYDALRLLFEAYLRLGKLKKGDGVLVAANSYIATVLAVHNAGLKPIFVEVEDVYFNYDESSLEKQNFKNVKALLITHMFGQIPPLQKIRQIVSKHNLLLIEDAAHAHGASRQGDIAGSIGDAAAFSFYPTKNLGALGDGGMITTSQKKLARVVASLRNYGRETVYENKIPGFNSRLDEIQAAWLGVKLPFLDTLNQQRSAIARHYTRYINNNKLCLPKVDDDQAHVYYCFVLRIENRSSFISYLEDQEIGYSLHYPVPPYKQEALSAYNHLSFPITEGIAKQSISIPIYPELSTQEIEYIVERLNAY